MIVFNLFIFIFFYSRLFSAVPATNGEKPGNIEKKKLKQQRNKERNEKNNAAKAKAKEDA